MAKWWSNKTVPLNNQPVCINYQGVERTGKYNKELGGVKWGENGFTWWPTVEGWRPNATWDTPAYDKYTFVHINAVLPDCMGAYPRDIDAIVSFTYAEVYGGDDLKSYSVYILGSDGKVSDHVSWYDENNFSKNKKQSKIKAKRLIAEYHGWFKNEESDEKRN